MGTDRYANLSDLTLHEFNVRSDHEFKRPVLLGRLIYVYLSDYT